MKRFSLLVIAALFLIVACFESDISAQHRRRSGRRAVTAGRNSTISTTTARRSRTSRTRRPASATTVTTTTLTTASNTACPTDLESCPAEGCGGAGIDLLLNRAKNRVSAPAAADIIQMSLDDIRNINQPDHWQPNRDRGELQGARREGQPVRVMGYLWRAKREHKESCNCGLDAPGVVGELLTDIHMVLTDKPNDPEAISVTAEITPRVRASLPDPHSWTWSRIKLNNGKFIRVTGYLMLDTEHLIHNPLVRATNWEVHPITKLEVCTSTEAQCRSGHGWRDLP